jgi:hypothetical protein
MGTNKPELHRYRKLFGRFENFFRETFDVGRHSNMDRKLRHIKLAFSCLQCIIDIISDVFLNFKNELLEISEVASE